jgi:uncharacterized protein YtpQ (UPF0354 family)
MNQKELKNKLEHAFQEKQWDSTWNNNKDIFEIYLKGQEKPFELSVPNLLQRINNESNEPNEVITQAIEQVQIMMDSVEARKSVELAGQDHNIFPVMRSTSFPGETTNGKKLVYDEHTAESRVYYAVDLGKSYTLVDEDMLNKSSWTKQEMKEKALFNLRGLKNEAKEDNVAGNRFYFIGTTDGYGASRILNQSLIQEYSQKVEGDLCLAIPHQDVLIFADLRNSTGYDVLGQMALHFYTNGGMPITPLPFDLKEGKLEPIFILAKRKPKN